MFHAIFQSATLHRLSSTSPYSCTGGGTISGCAGPIFERFLLLCCVAGCLLRRCGGTGFTGPCRGACDQAVLNPNASTALWRPSGGQDASSSWAAGCNEVLRPCEAGALQRLRSCSELDWPPRSARSDRFSSASFCSASACRSLSSAHICSLRCASAQPCAQHKQLSGLGQAHGCVHLCSCALVLSCMHMPVRHTHRLAYCN